ncbi:MAG: hypothetical protein L3J37_10285 [Rhodobacteraceae bacterium]|nr:hypothetical protein [Paracoccaceae bacterium]
MHKDELNRFGVIEAEVMIDSPQATLYAGRLVDGRQVVVKVLSAEGVRREGAGMRLLARYSGDNSVVVLAQEGRAVLMERLDGAMLIARWQAGESEAAEDVAIGLVRAAHEEGVSAEGLVDLEAHFSEALAWEESAAAEAQEQLRGLLAGVDENVALHGDVHPRNIMRRGAGWCLIDPIGLRGPPVFDYANMFLNPWDFAPVHKDSGRMARLVGKVSDACGANPQEVLGWAAANALWWADIRARRGLGFGYPMEMVERCMQSAHPT